MLSPERPIIEDPASGKQKIVRCLHQVIASHWPLVSLVICFLAALAHPSTGASAFSTIIQFLVPALFVIVGLTLDLSALAALLDWRNAFANAQVQVYSLAALPLIYYISVYHWKWETSLGILPASLAPGCMAVMCMPTTTTTGILFTMEAKGTCV